jgi:hypothetical protein
LKFAIEALQCALISDGLQYEETIKKSKPLFHKEEPHPKYLSPDTNAFVKDCIKAYASLASDSQIWLNLLSSFDDEQREFTILEGTMACELAKSHLLPLHQLISCCMVGYLCSFGTRRTDLRPSVTQAGV